MKEIEIREYTDSEFKQISRDLQANGVDMEVIAIVDEDKIEKYLNQIMGTPCIKQDNPPKKKQYKFLTFIRYGVTFNIKSK